MKEKLDPIIVLDGMIGDLKMRSQVQDEVGNMAVLTKLVDKITQIKNQCLFEIAQHEYATALSRQ